MFAYTGLTPQQMDTLAKEVSTHEDQQKITLTDSLVFRLRDEGWPHIGCRHHLRQRQAPGRVYPQSDPVTAARREVGYRRSKIDAAAYLTFS